VTITLVLRDINESKSIEKHHRYKKNNVYMYNVKMTKVDTNVKL